MSLFASGETVKLYIEGDEVVDKETDTWVEVKKELPISLAEKLNKLRNASVIMREDRIAEIKLDSLDFLPPFDILAKIIVGWSEPVPVNPANIAKMKHSVLRNIWAKLSEMYGLGGNENAPTA